MGEALAILMFPVTILTVLAGYPVAFTLAGVALLFGTLGIYVGIFEPSLLSALSGRYFGTMTNEVLVAVPLFVFMGVMLERSKIAEQLLTTMGEIFGSMRGGLGISVIAVGALLAASTGIVGATVVTMGLLSLPVMTRAGYDPKLATGAICASGTLGQIIPPSTVLIFMGDILQGANQQAQLQVGNFSPDPLSVGQLFAGAMLPGLMLVVLYIFWIVFCSIVDPESCPALKFSLASKKGLPRRIVVALAPPLLLIFAVLGSILTGVATPTESASVGAVGAMCLAAFRKQLSLPILKEVMRSTLMINSMVFVILLGASVFSLVFRGLGGDDFVYDILAAMPGGRAGAVLAVMLVIFVLGFFLDTFEIIFITVPIAAPVLIRLGVDPIWLGVLIGMNLQTSFLTPPFGFALFYLRGVADSAIRTIDIYRGAIPFVGLQVIGIGLLWFFPELATWLPDTLYSNEVMAAPANSIEDPAGTANNFGIDVFDNLLNTPNQATSRPELDQFDGLISN